MPSVKRIGWPAAAIVGLLLWAGSAGAKEICLNLASGTVLALNLSAYPAKNSCKSISVTSDSVPGLIGNGSICTASDGGTVLFTYSNVFTGGFEELGGTFEKSTGQGSLEGCAAMAGAQTFCNNGPATLSKCKQSIPPAASPSVQSMTSNLAP